MRRRREMGMGKKEWRKMEEREGIKWKKKKT